MANSAASSNNTTQSVLQAAVAPLKEAGVSSLALGIGVGVTALAVQVAVVTGKALVANAKGVAESLKS